MQDATQALAALLRQVVETDRELCRRVTVVAGPEASADPAPEAGRLRALGSSWEWVALRLDPHRFWDLHVGVLPVPEIGGHFHVGLHWSTTVDHAVRPFARRLLPGSDLLFSTSAQEHQLTLSEGGRRSEFPMRLAADTAKQMALLALGAGFPASTATQRPRNV